jgi:hypothetical protein
MGYCASTADLRINCTYCVNTFAQQMAQWLAQPGLLMAQPVQPAYAGMSGSYYSYNGQSAAPGGAPAASRAGHAPRGGARCLFWCACTSCRRHPPLARDGTASGAGGANGGRRGWPRGRRARAGVPWQLVFQCNDTASNVRDMLSMAGQIGAEMAPVFAAGASNATAICYGHPDICSGPNNSPGTPLPRWACGPRALARRAGPPRHAMHADAPLSHTTLRHMHSPCMLLSAPVVQAAIQHIQ